MSADADWTPLPLPGPGLRRVRGLVALCRILAGPLTGAPAPTDIDWRAVAAIAEAHRLTPALWEVVSSDDTLEANIAVRLRAEYAVNVVATRRAWDQLREVIAGFNRGGLQPVVLKGGAALLEQGGHPTPARVMADIDLLVADGETDRARSISTEMGYRLEAAPGLAAGWEWSAVRADRAAPVDLHRALGPSLAESILPTPDVVQRSVERQTDGLHYRILAPEDQLAHAVIHSELTDKAHRSGSVSIRQLHNFAALYRRLGDPGAWSQAVARLDHPRTRPLVAGHAALERFLFGLDLFEPEPRLRGRGHLARCLASFAVPHLSDVHTNLLLALDAQTMAARYPGSSTRGAQLGHSARTLRAGIGSVRQAALQPRNR